MLKTTDEIGAQTQRQEQARARAQTQDRAKGAIVGAYIGDALGLGPHWYYDLDALKADYGDWIDTYTTPKSDRYHGGMSAGQQSQSGIILNMLIDQLLADGEYDEAEFCRRLDGDLFPHLDGTADVGPGGFTSQSIRETWSMRSEQNKPWGEVSGNADNTEAAERIVALSVRYARQPEKLAKSISCNTRLTQCDETVNSMTVTYGAVLAMLVQGHRLDGTLSEKLLEQVEGDKLPCQERTYYETPSNVAVAAGEGLIDPAWQVSKVYGMSCAVQYVLPACYYLAARFPDDFEAGVLHAINGGGQNMARAMLTGALIGAQVGLAGIPKRFIDGLENSNQLLERAEKLSCLACN